MSHYHFVCRNNIQVKMHVLISVTGYCHLAFIFKQILQGSEEPHRHEF